MILISQNKTAAVELNELYTEDDVEDEERSFRVMHVSNQTNQYYAHVRMGKYRTNEEAISQIEAIAKALEAGRQVYKFD